MKRSTTLGVALLAAIVSGCASSWKPRSTTQATVYAETTEIPVLFADSTFVGAVDGINTVRGKGYVLVDPGHRALTVFHVSCPLPIIAVLCLRSTSKREIKSSVVAGAAYRIGKDQLTEVRPNGQPVEVPSQTSPVRNHGE